VSLTIMTELDPDILAIAEATRLNEYKKNMLVSKEILNHPDKEIRRHVQKVLLSKLVNASESKAKYLRDQEIRNLRAGNVYIKDPVTKQIIKYEHNIDRIPTTKEIAPEQRHLRRFSKCANDLMKQLTGTNNHGFDTAVISRTVEHRKELCRRMRDIELGRIYNKMFAVKAAIDDEVQLLDMEMEARRVKKELLKE
jgi:hypothetical protein